MCEFVHDPGECFQEGHFEEDEIAVKLGWDFPVRNGLGDWNGKPVATASLFFGAGAFGSSAAGGA